MTDSTRRNALELFCIEPWFFFFFFFDNLMSAILNRSRSQLIYYSLEVQLQTNTGAESKLKISVILASLFK